MKTHLVLLSLASTVFLSALAVAAETKPADAEKAEKAASIDFYATFLPFAEYVTIGGPTAQDVMEAPDHMIGNVYTGVEGAPRFRMTAGTSNFGFRGSLALVEQLRVIGQFETALAVDGNPNPWSADVPNRNTYLGVAGDWGTLAFGILDTPYKWSTTTTVNPIRGGYVADYVPIIGTPGFGATAVNSTQGPQSNESSNAAFYRREANSIQYWSPTLFGLYLRLSYTMNENRASGQEGLSVRTNYYILSGAVGFDLAGLRLRYAYEMHHDFFGMGGVTALTGPSFEIPTSTDQAHKGVAQYVLSINPNLKTRIAAIGELLDYQHDDSTVDQVDEYSRPAYYALLEQTVFHHHIWGAFGQAFKGKCHRVGGASCTTDHLGAMLVEFGYMYAFNQNANLHVLGYHLRNERAANYVTAPALPRTALSPGEDTTGVGVGFYYAFDADLLD